MNKQRIALIDTVFGDRATLVKDALFVVAKRVKATVDDVIQAGLGRGASPAGAAGAQQLKTAGFDFEPLAAAWPWVCPACDAYVATLERCGECGEKVGPECIGTYGCPECTAKAQARIDRGKTATAEQEQTRKWMQRQMAEPLPEEEPEELAHDPVPPPPPAPPVPPDVHFTGEPLVEGQLIYAGPRPAAPGDDEPTPEGVQ